MKILEKNMTKKIKLDTQLNETHEENFKALHIESCNMILNSIRKRLDGLQTKISHIETQVNSIKKTKKKFTKIK